MTRHYLRYAINDAADRRKESSGYRLALRFVLFSVLGPISKRVKGLATDSPDNCEEPATKISVSTKKSEFDIIGFRADHFDGLFSSVKIKKHKLDAAVIRRSLSLFSIFYTWLFALLKYRKMMDLQYLARYVAGYNYAAGLEIETETLLFTETRNAYIYGILDGLHRVGAHRRKIFFSDLLATGCQQRYFDSNDYIVSVTAYNCSLYNPKVKKGFPTPLFRLIDGCRLGLEARKIHDAWVWIGQEILFQQEKKMLKKLVSFAASHDAQVIYWTRSGRSISYLKNWLLDNGIKIDVTSKADYLPALCFGNYSNLLMTMSKFGVRTFSMLDEDCNSERQLLDQLKEYGVTAFDQAVFDADWNNDDQGPVFPLKLIEFETARLIEFICG